ncbi:hypothetical protein [Oceanobacillus massiliensis]|uniref:hypothetical protein n=1 Tax=Oceanobacillus massiliensis TaxID=1465765 RepID=UPI000287CAE9|nr:hypothetical protein [Oceanobacillus massiliensis]
MFARKEKHKRIGGRSRSISLKIMMGSILSVIVISGSIGIVFADQDLESVLLNWFNNKEASAISDIDLAVEKEKAEQMKRLKSAMQEEIKKSEIEMDNFKDKEKQKITASLKQYADQLISGMEIDNTEEKSQLKSQLESILSDAETKMQQVYIPDADASQEDHAEKEKDDEIRNKEVISKEKAKESEASSTNDDAESETADQAFDEESGNEMQPEAMDEKENTEEQEGGSNKILNEQGDE